MRTLPRKVLRTLTREIDRVVNEKSLFAPQSLADIKSVDLKAVDYFSREIRLSGNRTFLLTDKGYSAFKAIVTHLHEADLSEGLAQYSDLFNATKAVFQDCLSRGQRPDDGAELVELIGQILENQITTHTFVVPIYGVELKGIDSVRLGALRVVPSTAEWIKVLGGDASSENVAILLRHSEEHLWIPPCVSGPFQSLSPKTETTWKALWYERCIGIRTRTVTS
jgi:hypothetical protein